MSSHYFNVPQDWFDLTRFDDALFTVGSTIARNISARKVIAGMHDA